MPATPESASIGRAVAARVGSNIREVRTNSPRDAQRGCGRANADLRSESGPDPDAQPAREWQKQPKREENKQQRGSIENQPGNEGMRLPRRSQLVREEGPQRLSSPGYSVAKPSEVAKAVGTPNTLIVTWVSSWDARVASESLGPREARVRALRTGEDHVRGSW